MMDDLIWDISCVTVAASAMEIATELSGGALEVPAINTILTEAGPTLPLLLQDFLLEQVNVAMGTAAELVEISAMGYLPLAIGLIRVRHVHSTGEYPLLSRESNSNSSARVAPQIGSSLNCFFDRPVVTEPPKMPLVAEPTYTPSPMPDPETVSQKATPRTRIAPSFELQLPQRSVDIQADAPPKIPPASHTINELASPPSLPSPVPGPATDMSQKDSSPSRGDMRTKEEGVF